MILSMFFLSDSHSLLYLRIISEIVSEIISQIFPEIDS